MNEMLSNLMDRLTSLGLPAQDVACLGILALLGVAAAVAVGVKALRRGKSEKTDRRGKKRTYGPAPEAIAIGKAQGDNGEEGEVSDSSIADSVDVLANNKGVRMSKRPKAEKTSAPTFSLTGTDKKSAKALKQKGKALVIPKSVQDSIPYVAVYPDENVIETMPGVFTKTYLLRDTNYDSASDEDKSLMAKKYQEMLNSFDQDVKFEITVDQKNLDMEEFEAQTMLEMRDDGMDDLRMERNKMMRKKVLDKKKFLTVSTKAETIEEALNVFARLDNEIPGYIKKIGQAAAFPMKTVERLELLHDLYNVGQEGAFGNVIRKVEGRDGGTEYVWGDPKFSLDVMDRMGLTTKDVIAPDYLEFKTNYMLVGGKYARALYLRSVPEMVSDSIIKDVTSTTIDMTTSLHFAPISTETAAKRIKARLTSISAAMVDKQKKASRSGYDPSLISPELRQSHEMTAELLEEVSRKSQNMFEMSMVIVHFADTKEQLDSDTKLLQSVVASQKLKLAVLSEQQEVGLNTVLPLCVNQIHVSTTLTTESASAFTPFVNQELIDRNGGMFYGFNKISGNPILLNRRNLKNGNGFIFGTPGSGKSFSAKQEMMTVLLSTPDTVLVVDPEAEYYPMAEMLGGEVVRIAAGSDVYINPLDIDMDADSEDDPIAIKSDFIASFCDAIGGDRSGISPAQRSIIDRCLKKAYEPYLNSYDPETRTYDPEKMPTLVEFFNIVKMQQGFDAAQLRDMLELYVVGSQNIFAHRTNVDYKGRFVVFDIRDTGSTLKNVALLVVLDYVWNQIVAGRKRGQYTWFFVDEIYLLFKQQSSAEFLKNLYKRARKYYGIPTGITQNVSDLLRDETARTMIANSEYLELLDQKSEDRLILQELLKMSDAELSFITNSSPGEGIIFNGVSCIPFVNHLDRDTKQYKAMTTKPGEAVMKGDMAAIMAADHEDAEDAGAEAPEQAVPEAPDHAEDGDGDE